MASTDTSGKDAGDWAGLTCRVLERRDVEGACALSNAAHWNQTARDWEYMIVHGRGWGLFNGPDDLVATALTLPQPGGRFGWISMVLVEKHWQRKGLATKLLQQCVDSLLASGLTPGLDATEFGRPVYLPLGFKDVYRLTRMERMVSQSADDRQANAVEPVTAADMTGIQDLDLEISGGDRSVLLNHLANRMPQLALKHAGKTAKTSGYCFGRDGVNAGQVGPIVADGPDVAIELTGQALSSLKGAVFIDVADHQTDFLQWLISHGFSAQRSFVRMLHERTRPFDQPAKIYAIAGPELG